MKSEIFYLKIFIENTLAPNIILEKRHMNIVKKKTTFFCPYDLSLKQGRQMTHKKTILYIQGIGSVLVKKRNTSVPRKRIREGLAQEGILNPNTARWSRLTIQRDGKVLQAEGTEYGKP